MMEEKDFDDSEYEDPDFVIDLESNSSQSECESKINETNFSINNNLEEQRKKRFKKLKCTNNIFEKHYKKDSKNDDTSNDVTVAAEKARSDMLWKNFLCDAGTSFNSTSTSINTSKVLNDSNDDKIDAQKNIYTNAKYDKEKNLTVNNNRSNKAEKLIGLQTEIKDDCNMQFKRAKKNKSTKRSITSILNNINKKSKLTTLEKSKLEWNKFKDEQNLHEEISNFNRGKNGYLEKQDFLQRADTRQFEIEKELRRIGKQRIQKF